MTKSSISGIPLINVHSHQLSEGFLSVYQNAVENPEQNAAIYSMGIHPLSANPSTTETLTKLAAQLTNPACIAIGESGLDKNAELSTPRQVELFREHMELSIVYQKPIIIHCVGRWNELELLFKEKKTSSPAWIIHGFRKMGLAEKFLDLGAYLSFGKALLYDNHIHEAITGIPIERIFLETDDSDADLAELYRKLAELKMLSLPAVTEQLYSNFKRVFYHDKLA